MLYLEVVITVAEKHCATAAIRARKTEALIIYSQFRQHQAQPQRTNSIGTAGEIFYPKIHKPRKTLDSHCLYSIEDQSNLLGLYRGLMLLNVPAKELHTWQVQLFLVENTVRIFEMIPVKTRGRYYPWFLKNKSILDGLQTSQQAKVDMLSSYFDEAWLYLASEERAKKPGELSPEAKNECFLILAMATHAARPAPSMHQS